MTRAMPAIVSLVVSIVVWSSWAALRDVPGRAHAGPRDAPESPAGRYRDPFVPKAVPPPPVSEPAPPSPAPVSAPEPEPVSLTVLVRGIASSPQGRWALLEFENGEQLIVRTGQVIAAFSRVVTRITDQGVTLSALGGAEAPSPADRTYFLDQ